ncbi:MAG: hypothetical protein AABZ60_06440, partial [Planctomycetota bacterium]
MKPAHKLLLLKIFFLLAPIVLVLGGLHLSSRSIHHQYTLSSLGKEYDLLEEPFYDIYVKKSDEALGKKYGQFLQSYYLEFLKQFQKDFSLSPYPQKISIHLLKTRQEFDDYVQGDQRIELPYSAGYYSPNKRSIVLYIEGQDVFQALIHEHIHAIFDFSLNLSFDPNFSRCLGEGLACFFENAISETQDDGYQFFDFEKKPDSFKVDLLQQAIHTNLWIPLEDLIASTDSHFTGQTNFFYYYQSELLVYYLW